MSDTATKNPVRVSVHEKVAPTITVPVTQLDRVRDLLAAHQVQFWVAHLAISIDGKPAETVINLARGTDPARVQALLDTLG